jgi:hypothetical protein
VQANHVLDDTVVFEHCEESRRATQSPNGDSTPTLQILREHKGVNDVSVGIRAAFGHWQADADQTSRLTN